MLKYPEDTVNASAPSPSGRWMWNDESQTLEFVSSYPAEEAALRKKTQTNVSFTELQQRAEWLADMCILSHRGRQSIKKRLSSAHLTAFSSSLMKRQGDHITIDDVKQVAVRLLRENYLLPIPFCFLDVLKSKELDEVLTALLLYLSYFFEHKSLENKSPSLVVVDITTEHKMMMEILAKKEIAQKKLAVWYFGLMMDLQREQHPPCYKDQMSSNTAHWQLHALVETFKTILPHLHTKMEPSAGQSEGQFTICDCRRFFCYFAWVTFDRKDLRDIQEELGRLLYSDAFNTAMRNRTDGDSGMTSATVNASVKTGAPDPKEMRYNSAFKRRTSQRRPSLASIVNQRSPLMVTLLPSAKERSPHLFLGSRARSQSRLQTEHCDIKALTEQLDQQLASVSFGILGKPLSQFSRSTLIPNGEQKNNQAEDEDDESGSDVNNNATDHSGIHAQGSKLSFVGPKSTGLSRYGRTAHTDAKNSAATIDPTY